MKELRPRLPEEGVPPFPVKLNFYGALSHSWVFFVLNDETRFKILLLLMDGQPRSVRQLARALGRKFNGVSKQLAVLRLFNIVEVVTPEGADGRSVWHRMPAAFRATPGVLDFGCCLVRL